MPVQLNSSSGDEGDEARIEIIPLIDIMFFLLASFMMVSLSMTQLHRVPVNLPEASTGVADSKTPPFQIAIDPNGVITWDCQDRHPVGNHRPPAKGSHPGGNPRAHFRRRRRRATRTCSTCSTPCAPQASTKVSFESKNPNP